MNYKPELGLIGNIKLLFSERNITNNNVFNEVNDRKIADEEVLAQTDDIAISLYEAQQEQDEALIQADETAISLYESQELQETINAQQDEALMEIYEMIG